MLKQKQHIRFSDGAGLSMQIYYCCLPKPMAGTIASCNRANENNLLRPGDLYT